MKIDKKIETYLKEAVHKPLPPNPELEKQNSSKSSKVNKALSNLRTQQKELEDRVDLIKQTIVNLYSRAQQEVLGDKDIKRYTDKVK